MKQRNLKEIQNYWDSAAAVDADADSLRPTARDRYLQEALEHAMSKWLSEDARLLDVGCGDGRSTVFFAAQVRSVLGIDYIDKFVARSRAHATESGVENASFEVGSVLDLAQVREGHGLFDVAISIRCLINLDSWANQARALRELASCVRPGGLLLISEGWQEGMDGLNDWRARATLEEMSVADFNLLISRRDFEQELEPLFETVHYESLGFYLFISRVLMPRFVTPDAPTHLHPLNELAGELQRSLGLQTGFDPVDYAGIYVLRRRADPG